MPPADENIVGDSTNKMCYYRIHVPELRMFRLLCSREKQSATATTTANFTIADNSTNSSTSSQVIAPAPAQTPTSIKHYIFARGQYQDNVPTFIEPIILPPSYKVPDEESVSVCGTDKEQSSSSSAGIEAELAVLERKLSFDDSISDSFSVFSLSSPTVEDSAIELYYLRLILLTRPVLSFEDARTGSDGTIYSTFKEAACSYQLTSKILSSKV